MGLPCAKSKSREIDSISPAGRFDSTHIAVPDRWAQAPGAAALNRCISIPGISDFHHLSPVFALVGASPTERRSSRPAPAAMSLARCLYNRCEIARCGFGGLAFDSVRERRVDRHQPLVAVRTPTIAVSTGSIRKYRIKTVSCRETSITNACYLCNTLWKRGGLRSLEAVPLLRVQKSSVIVITRRRGASRGRPVLGGSLKSTRATRSR